MDDRQRTALNQFFQAYKESSSAWKRQFAELYLAATGTGPDFEEKEPQMKSLDIDRILRALSIFMSAILALALILRLLTI